MTAITVKYAHGDSAGAPLRNNILSRTPPPPQRSCIILLQYTPAVYNYPPVCVMS